MVRPVLLALHSDLLHPQIRPWLNAWLGRGGASLHGIVKHGAAAFLRLARQLVQVGSVIVRGKDGAFAES